MAQSKIWRKKQENPQGKCQGIANVRTASDVLCFFSRLDELLYQLPPRVCYNMKGIRTCFLQPYYLIRVTGSRGISLPLFIYTPDEEAETSTGGQGEKANVGILY